MLCKQDLEVFRVHLGVGVMSHSAINLIKFQERETNKALREEKTTVIDKPLHQHAEMQRA